MSFVASLSLRVSLFCDSREREREREREEGRENKRKLNSKIPFLWNRPSGSCFYHLKHRIASRSNRFASLRFSSSSSSSYWKATRNELTWLSSLVFCLSFCCLSVYCEGGERAQHSTKPSQAKSSAPSTWCCGWAELGYTRIAIATRSWKPAANSRQFTAVLQ